MDTLGTDRAGRRAARWGGRALGVAVMVGVGVSCLAAGCRKKQPGPTYPSATYPTPTATPTPTPTPTPTATVAPFDEATKLALGAMIEARAPKEAAGMKPVGELFGGSAAAGGQVDSAVFMVEQAKCYTVLGQGGMGVTELDIKLVGGVGLLPPGTEPTLAVDNTTGAVAAITPCWKPLLGGPAKISLVARGGSGAVVGRVYMK